MLLSPFNKLAGGCWKLLLFFFILNKVKLWLQVWPVVYVTYIYIANPLFTINQNQSNFLFCSSTNMETTNKLKVFWPSPPFRIHTKTKSRKDAKKMMKFPITSATFTFVVLVPMQRTQPWFISFNFVFLFLCKKILALTMVLFYWLNRKIFDLSVWSVVTRVFD